MILIVSFFVFFPPSLFKCFQVLLFLFSISTAQDAGLDALAAVISRQKMMGQEIGNELDEQNGKFYFIPGSEHIYHSSPSLLYI